MTQNGNPKVFLGYIRKSIIDPNIDTASPARQRSAIERRLAATHPGSPIEWFEDLDKSGRNEANRPDWQRLLKRVHDPDVAGVIVESIDRNHRNLKQFLSFYDDVLAPAGKTLISALQNIDMSTADGRALASVIMTFAEMEAVKASERMSATLQQIREDGRHMGGMPFGCDRDPATKHLAPSQRAYLYSPATDEARPDDSPDDTPPTGFERRYYHDALRLLYERYATGLYGLAEVAIWLNASGWRNWGRSHKELLEFDVQTVRSIIHRWQIYAGRIPQAPKQKLGVRIRPVATQPGAYAPILPVELCEMASLVLTSRRGTGGPRSKTGQHVYLAGGLVYCGKCGAKMNGQAVKASGEGVYRYYRHWNIKQECNEGMARVEEIDGAVVGMVDEIIDSGLLDQALAEWRQVAAGFLIGISNTAEIERKQAEKERLIGLHVKGLITEEEFVKYRDGLQSEIDRLEVSVSDGQPLAEVEAIIGQLDTLLRNFEANNPLLQKEAVRGFFQRIEIRGKQISRIVPQEWCQELLCTPGAGHRSSAEFAQTIRLRFFELVDPAP